ncbi:MAG: replication-associated recombination protein A, partial [Bdellovibrionales bacterium]|nr:replication-associated recombination protein A [Bdellovibrionales bacterium]
VAKNLALFEHSTKLPKETAPLAEKLRPQSWKDFQGIDHLDQNLIRQLQSGSGKPPSLILWGPPGSGKTTLAKLIGNSYHSHFVEFSAVLGGVKEVREIVAIAKQQSLRTILFVDEIHRFNRAQQDAFLPHIEDGTIILIGATTENPSFYLTAPLLSRTKVLTLKPLNEAALKKILAAACSRLELEFDHSAVELLSSFAGGDARRLLNLVEFFDQSRKSTSKKVSVAELQSFLSDSQTLYYDRSGEEHYNMASAFIKSLRGSDPDAALYWGFRMIESGEDPRFVIRRMIIFASEDIGNADPRALTLAVSTWEAFDKIGLPEGRIPIAQCITYLASTVKSNRSYAAMHAALDAIKKNPRATVPLHLRNAPTKLMQDLEYGKEYQYPHNHLENFVEGVQYLPDEAKDAVFYKPSQQGAEKVLAERLTKLRPK